MTDSNSSDSLAVGGGSLAQTMHQITLKTQRELQQNEMEIAEAYAKSPFLERDVQVCLNKVKTAAHSGLFSTKCESTFTGLNSSVRLFRKALVSQGFTVYHPPCDNHCTVSWMNPQ